MNGGDLNIIENEKSFYDCHYLLSLTIIPPSLLEKLLNSLTKQLEQIFITLSTIEDINKIGNFTLFDLVLDKINPTMFIHFINTMYDLYKTNPDHKEELCAILVNFIKTVENLLPIMPLEHVWEMVDFLYEEDTQAIIENLLTHNNIKFIPTHIIIACYNDLIESTQIHYNYYNYINIMKRESQQRDVWLEIVFPPLKIGKTEYHNEIDLYQVHNELNQLIAPLRKFIEEMMNHYKTEIVFDLTIKINPEQVEEIESQIDESLNEAYFNDKDIYIYLKAEISRLFADDEDKRIAANAVLDYLCHNDTSAAAQFMADMRFIISFLLDDRPAWVGDFASRDSRIKALIEGLIQSAKIYGNNNRAIETRVSCPKGCYERVLDEIVKLTNSFVIFKNTYAICQMRASIDHKLKNKLVYNKDGINTIFIDQFITHIANIAAQSDTSTITLENVRDIIITEEIKIHTEEINIQLEEYNKNHEENDIPPELLSYHTNKLWNEVSKPTLEKFLLETLDAIIEVSDESLDLYSLVRIKNMAIKIQNN